LNPQPSHDQSAKDLQAIAAHVEREWREDFGVFDPALAERVARTYAEIAGDPAWRFAIMRRYAPEARCILDLSSGFGTAVFHGLSQGYEAFGVEPDISKHELAPAVLRLGGCPEAWRLRNLRAFGEALPFRDGAFDVVMSYQTLEHVSDPEAVLGEMLRVLRKGGGLHLHCPDYSGTFEGHYLLPWFPGLPKKLMGKVYRLWGRPMRGLQGIHPITRKQVMIILGSIQSRNDGLRFHCVDLEIERARQRVKEHVLGRFPGAFLAYRCLTGIRRLFRSEKPLHVWITRTC
jgi:SAM-dependent methyltransferase